jgi:hypothetical protein
VPYDVDDQGVSPQVPLKGKRAGLSEQRGKSGLNGLESGAFNCGSANSLRIFEIKSPLTSSNYIENCNPLYFWISLPLEGSEGRNEMKIRSP